MPDYGHDLAFGTFITPGIRRPEDVVALAQSTERVGLELATFQDHPYQPAHLDAWTLLSFVAGRTETLRLAPNVLNLPLRQPAVVARSAASLDLLSGGRVELGLGAGAFWDAIEAMGGPRRTPGQAVDALQGPPEGWVEDLLPFVLQHGFSTFIVTGDDPKTIETFGREVAPALRVAVAEARAAIGTATGPVRGPRAKALRRESRPCGEVAQALAPHGSA